MADDLFGPKHREHLTRFLEAPVRPRHKLPRVPAPPPLRRQPPAVDAAQLERIRRQRAADYYAWACEEIERWTDRLPEAEVERLRAYVASLKPANGEQS